MKQFKFLFLATLFISTSAFAGNKKETITIKGNVLEKVNGKTYPMDKAYVYCENILEFTYSDKEGNFELNLPKGEHTVKVAFKGYDTKTLTYKVTRKSNDITVVLIPENTNLATK